ncbi:hypothetical protein [Empedobacter sp.]|uniref:hypothetical protein n=1 Tax=Empedobacter sp. TaxID=1927715 RepID=UPI00289708EB|nr:hypothetical protein [Empedobacter sp.]
MEFIATMAGKKVQVEPKQSSDIKNVTKDKKVMLFFENGDEYHGVFQFIDGSDVVIKSLTSNHMIGLPIKKLIEFYQEK